MPEPFEFTVDASQILMFARAVGDDNPVYRDPDHPSAVAAGGTIAPPTFTETHQQFQPDFPFRPHIGRPWFGSAGDAGSPPPDAQGDTSGSTLHAEQRFTYHRHVRPGDVLRATSRPGASWEKVSRSGETLKFSEIVTDFTDISGLPVITSTQVAVRKTSAAPGVEGA
jgi:hypothetical protein